MCPPCSRDCDGDVCACVCGYDAYVDVLPSVTAEWERLENKKTQRRTNPQSIVTFLVWIAPNVSTLRLCAYIACYLRATIDLARLHRHCCLTNLRRGITVSRSRDMKGMLVGVVRVKSLFVTILCKRLHVAFLRWRSECDPGIRRSTCATQHLHTAFARCRCQWRQHHNEPEEERANLQETLFIKSTLISVSLNRTLYFLGARKYNASSDGICLFAS